jgi:glycosyltransferase involved in cell wall biosynthesis
MENIENLDKTLYILTSEFPFGTSETFLENEIPFLKKSFKKIIFLTQNPNGNSRNCSYNFLSIEHSSNPMIRLRALFSTILLNELIQLIKKKKISVYKFRAAWKSLTMSFSILKKIEGLKLTENSSIEKIVFYSYWLDEKALALAMLKSKFKEIKTISRAHGWDIYEERHPQNYLPFRNFILNNLDLVLPISENGRSYLLKSNNIRLEKNIVVSRLGTPAVNKLIQFEKKPIFHLLSISSFVSLKRIELIIESLTLINKEVIHWTHIGSGPLEKEILQFATNQLTDKKNITFSFTGQKSNVEVRNFLEETQVDLFINLSETEGIPVSIMEAQSTGITVLATAVGGTPEIVNNENGFLVDKTVSPTEIAQLIHYYLNLPEADQVQKRKLSLMNWELFFNAKKNYEKFIELIE